LKATIPCENNYDLLATAFNGQPLKATMPYEKGGQALTKPTEEELDSWPIQSRSEKSRDCRLSLRESSVSCEFGFGSEKALAHAPFALNSRFSRKHRCFRGAKGDNGISLVIDEHQNSRRGGQKQAKKISEFRYLSGDANVSAYWLYVYAHKCVEKYFRLVKEEIGSWARCIRRDNFRGGKVWFSQFDPMSNSPRDIAENDAIEAEDGLLR
jgi:hypothetical protein